MGFCALRRRFFGGFFLKFFGIFRKMVFFCDFSLRFLSLSRMFYFSHRCFFSHGMHGIHGNAVATPACHSEFISPSQISLFSPTDYSDLKDFNHPELTIRFFAAQNRSTDFHRFLPYGVSPTDVFSLTESSFFYFPTNCTNVTNLFL